LILLLEDEEIKAIPGENYTKPFFKNVNFPENLKSFEDYSTLFKIFHKTTKVAKSNKKLYHYIQREDSLSHNLSPETAYFLFAIMEVFRFWQSSETIGNQRKISKNIIRKLLMVLKRIIRNTSVNK
jgi:hypothetical protein